MNALEKVIKGKFVASENYDFAIEDESAGWQLS